MVWEQYHQYDYSIIFFTWTMKASYSISLHPLFFPLYPYSDCYLPEVQVTFWKLQTVSCSTFAQNPSFSNFFIWTEILSLTFEDFWHMQISSGVLSFCQAPLFSQMLLYKRLCHFVTVLEGVIVHCFDCPSLLNCQHTPGCQGYVLTFCFWLYH